MSDGIRCPHCKKKLLETLNGMATVYCRHCKHTVTLNGHSVTYSDATTTLPGSMGKPITRRLDDERYEHIFE